MAHPGSVAIGSLLVVAGVLYAVVLYLTRLPPDARAWTDEQARAAHRRRLSGLHVRAILALIIIGIAQILDGIR